MPLIVRKGDGGSHGGSVITGAARWRCEGAPIARIGDIYDCPIHGPNPIASGASRWRCENAAIARDGDTTACGASLNAGARKWAVE